MNGAIDIPDGPAVTLGGKPHVFQDTIDTMHTGTIRQNRGQRVPVSSWISRRGSVSERTAGNLRMIIHYGKA